MTNNKSGSLIPEVFYRRSGCIFTDTFNELTELADKHHIVLPQRFTMLVRSIVTIEGVIEEFCPELNLFELVSNKIMERMKHSFDLKGTILNFGKDLMHIGEKTSKLPGLVADTMSNLNKGRLKVNMEITGFEEPLDSITEFTRYVILCLFSCVLFIGSCILALTDFTPKVDGSVPLISAVGILFSIALGIFAVKKLWKI